VEKVRKRYIVICIAVILLFCAGIVVAYFVGRNNRSATGSIGLQLNNAAELNREIADEQRRAADNNQRAIEFAERIRRITAEANSSYTELGIFNRGSGDISAQIRAENKLLSDYYRNINDIVDYYSSNNECE
jgi:hypothetical protein